MRRQHILDSNVKSESPTECVYFDTETNSTLQPDGSQVLTLKFGMACYTRKHRGGKWTAGMWYTFADAYDFWNWIDMRTRPGHKLYMFAHNLIFDMTVLHGFTILEGRKWLLIKAIVDDPPTILHYRQGKSSLCLLDTFNWFHSSLKDLGSAMGLPKLDMPDQGASQDAWHAYCQRDVEILRQAMQTYLAFIKDNDLGNFQKTAASQAFSAYRHRFMPYEILIDSNEKALDLARSSYYGGRVEAFFIGKREGDFYLLDVNSMYPFVMANNSFPTHLRSVYKRVKLGDLPAMLAEHLVVADVDLKTDEPAYPYRTPTGLICPVGQFRTVLPTPELVDALAHFRIVRVHSAAVYDGAQLFEGYVTTLYGLRKSYQAAGNLPFEYLCKLMLNSLYGKFGQRGRVFQDAGIAQTSDAKTWEEWDADTKRFVRYRQFGGLVQTWQNEGESFNSHPAVAAHVTSYARLWLWKLITTAGRQHVFYCDTDSLVVDKSGYDILASAYLGDGLGELKLVKQFSRMTIHGAKDYQFGDKIRIKGIRENATMVSENDFLQDRFGKFKTMVRNGDMDQMVVARQPKHLTRIYSKGFVTASGFVQPFVFPDDADQFMPARYQSKPGGIGGSRRDNRFYDQAKRADMRANLDRGKTMMEVE